MQRESVQIFFSVLSFFSHLSLKYFYLLTDESFHRNIF